MSTSITATSSLRWKSASSLARRARVPLQVLEYKRIEKMIGKLGSACAIGPVISMGFSALIPHSNLHAAFCFARNAMARLRHVRGTADDTGFTTSGCGFSTRSRSVSHSALSERDLASALKRTSERVVDARKSGASLPQRHCAYQFASRRGREEGARVQAACPQGTREDRVLKAELRMMESRNPMQPEPWPGNQFCHCTFHNACFYTSAPSRPPEQF